MASPVGHGFRGANETLLTNLGTTNLGITFHGRRKPFRAVVERTSHGVFFDGEGQVFYERSFEKA